MTIQEAIKAAQKTKGLTQGDLAEKLGTGQSNLSMRLKSGNRMLVENLLGMANACGYDVVLVDRGDTRNAFVIGDRDNVAMAPGDEAFDVRIREIVADEIAKRERGTQVVVTNRIPKK